MKLAPILRCWAEIDHRSLRSNLSVIRDQIPATTAVIGIIKANAYGHGALAVARTLKQAGVKWFGVASAMEAVALQDHGIRGSILILGAALREEYELIIQHRLVMTLSSFQEAKRLNQVAEKLNQKVVVHFKIDTGMGRLGAWWEEAEVELKKITKLPFLQVKGIYTHFSSADTDDVITKIQVRRLLRYLPWFKGRMVHASNSAGFFGSARVALNGVRPGISLYGDLALVPYQKKLKPVLSWKTKVTAIQTVSRGRTLSYGATYTVKKRSKIAVLAVGYADGYPRLLSNRGAVLIRGKRAPVRGRVTMDQILVDVSHIAGVRVGDEAVLIGSSGKLHIFAAELAQKTGTISYEILCGISERVLRIHRHVL